jgi:hypothetical protein
MRFTTDDVATMDGIHDKGLSRPMLDVAESEQDLASRVVPFDSATSASCCWLRLNAIEWQPDSPVRALLRPEGASTAARCLVSSSQRNRSDQRGRTGRFSITLSISPYSTASAGDMKKSRSVSCWMRSRG